MHDKNGKPLAVGDFVAWTSGGRTIHGQIGATYAAAAACNLSVSVMVPGTVQVHSVTASETEKITLDL